jgi:hypothetical protein
MLYRWKGESACGLGYAIATPKMQALLKSGEAAEWRYGMKRLEPLSLTIEKGSIPIYHPFTTVRH